MLNAAWHWGTDSSGFNDPFGGPGRTPLYLVLPSAWGSVDGDVFLSCMYVGGLIFGDSGRHT